MTTEVKLAGISYQLRWNKGAMFRADEFGVWDRKKPGAGFAKAAKYICAMIPDEGREKYPTPEAVAQVMPSLTESWDAINAAIEGAGPEMDSKNVVGSTSGPSP